MDQASAQPAAHHHSPPQGFIRKYVFSLDHKVIGLQYYGLALVAVFTAWCSPGSCASTSAGRRSRFRCLA